MPNILTFTEAGGRLENEDALLVVPHSGDADSLICVLADGQGGQPHGGPAARLACRAAIDLAHATPPAELLLSEWWTTTLGQVDRKVQTDPGAGLTTLVAFCVGRDQVLGASSGDSAAVALIGDRSARVLTARQFKNPPVGSGVAAFVPFETNLIAPWMVLVMSDGVWKYVGWEAILGADPARSAEEILAELQARARLPGSGKFQDDFTLGVVRDARDLP
jgi:PPM family protein phosphatase